MTLLTLRWRVNSHSAVFYNRDHRRTRLKTIPRQFQTQCSSRGLVSLLFWPWSGSRNICTGMDIGLACAWFRRCVEFHMDLPVYFYEEMLAMVSNMSVYLSACLPVCLSACLPACLSVCLDLMSMVSVSVRQSICLLARWPAGLSVWLQTCLFH